MGLDVDVIHSVSVRSSINDEEILREEYISLADFETGEEVEGIVPEKILLSTAVRIGERRLIDNVILE